MVKTGNVCTWNLYYFKTFTTHNYLINYSHKSPTLITHIMDCIMKVTKWKYFALVLRNDLLCDGVYFTATCRPNHNYSVNNSSTHQQLFVVWSNTLCKYVFNRSHNYAISCRRIAIAIIQLWQQNINVIKHFIIFQEYQKLWLCLQSIINQADTIEAQVFHIWKSDCLVALLSSQTII